MVHDEGHDPRCPVLRWVSHHSKAANHLATHHIVISPTWGLGSLTGEHFVIVAMIGSGFTICTFIALLSGLGHERTQWTRRLIGRRFPIQSITFALRAHEL